jgi:hypothetical protein
VNRSYPPHGCNGTCAAIQSAVTAIAGHISASVNWHFTRLDAG